MSKAFVKDDAISETEVEFNPIDLGPVCYITPQGMTRLQADLANLRIVNEPSLKHPSAGKLKKRIQYLESLIARAEVIDPTAQSGNKARFGATVTVRDEAELQRTYKIVGIYEADSRAGKVSYLSPIAKALLGSGAGDLVYIETPQSNEELEILKVEFLPID